jgi:hypothetical protein
MAKTNISNIERIATTHKTTRTQLMEALEKHYKAARVIEDALGTPTRILPETGASPRAAANGSAKNAIPRKVFDAPRKDTIMRKVWECLQAFPGSESDDLRKKLKMTSPTGKVAMSTALHTLKRHKQIRVRGKRGAYKYFAVTG